MEEKEGRRIRGGQIMRGGGGKEEVDRRGDNLSRDATFPWSRVLTHPLR